MAKSYYWSNKASLRSWALGPESKKNRRVRGGRDQGCLVIVPKSNPCPSRALFRDRTNGATMPGDPSHPRPAAASYPAQGAVLNSSSFLLRASLTAHRKPVTDFSTTYRTRSPLFVSLSHTLTRETTIQLTLVQSPSTPPILFQGSSSSPPGGSYPVRGLPPLPANFASTTSPLTYLTLARTLYSYRPLFPVGATLFNRFNSFFVCFVFVIVDSIPPTLVHNSTISLPPWRL